MKDLKQIQEFFSKPLEEVTKSQMLKKAKKGSYPATLVAIENGKVVAQEKVSTPQEAPAAHSVMSKKYPNANIRLEDSTGKILEEISKEDAWKKFQKEKSVTDKTIKAARKDFEKEWEAGKLKEGTFDQGEIAIYIGHDDSGTTHIFKRGKGYYGYNDEFDFEAASKEELQQKLDKWGYELLAGSLEEAQYTDYSNKELAAYCKNNPTDKKAAKELHKRSQALKGLTRTDEAKKLTFNDFVRMVRDDMMAGAAPDERPSEELVGKRAKAYYNDYLQGASVDDLFEAVNENALGFNDSRLTSDQHRDLDYAVRGDSAYTFGNDPYADDQLRYKYAVKMGFLEEAKVEVDDETEFKLDLKHLLDKHVVEQGYSLTKEHETDPNLELKVGDYQTQHFHMCPGAKSLYQDIENKVEDMGLAIRSAKLQDALFAMEESALKNGANEADVFAAETIADQIMAMASMMGLDKEHSYIQGHVDKIKGAVDKEQVAESSTSEERRIAKRAIRSIAKYRGVSEDEARNDLIRAANELGDLKENMSLDDEAKAYYLEKLKKGEIDTLPEDPKAAFLDQMMKDQIAHDKETLRRERGLEESAAYIAETIKLGLMLNEELCDKGKRYIKARQAAGEKSSAYLSGRAVRVCKGQIEWPKKGKK